MSKKILFITFCAVAIMSKEIQNNQNSWWTIFNNTNLNYIVENGLKNSHSLKSSVSKTKQTHESTKIIRSQLLPSIYANGRWNSSDINGYQGSPNSKQPEFMNNGSISLDARYRLDSWGEEMQQLKSYRYIAQASRAELENSKLIFAIHTTNLYFDAIFTKVQIDILLKQKMTAEKLLDLTKLRYENGESSGLTLLQQKQQVAATTASIPPAKLHHHYLHN